MRLGALGVANLLFPCHLHPRPGPCSQEAGSTVQRPRDQSCSGLPVNNLNRVWWRLHPPETRPKLGAAVHPEGFWL